MTITIKNIDSTTARWLTAEAQKRGVSENELALEMLKRQIEAQNELPIFHELDHLFGTWSEHDAKEFELATEDFNRIDEMLWR
jgi:hypothetical protein